MDHSEATRINASERYVRGELTSPEAENFEEHFFSCTTCAADINLEHAFSENVKAVFREQPRPATELSAKPARLGWREGLAARWSFASWAPLAATACLLAIVGFQNALTIPKLRMEVAQVSSGEAPFPFPLKLARGSEVITVPRSSFLFTPYFLLPGDAASGHFICDIETAAGQPVKHFTVAAPPAGQPLALLLKRSDFPSGTYRLQVRGENGPDPIATYTMNLRTD
ncbi:MAG: zf-HC2 domain-containing protein [Acidobacteriota bacterium]|nr:zf-HC2 domain-containing protein [Acidobacteriota bacterium]